MRTLVDASALSADAGGWSHMGGWGWGMAISGWLFMMLLVSLVGWLIWSAARRPKSSNDDRRYVRGEPANEVFVQLRYNRCVARQHHWKLPDSGDIRPT